MEPWHFHEILDSMKPGSKTSHLVIFPLLLTLWFLSIWSILYQPLVVRIREIPLVDWINARPLLNFPAPLDEVLHEPFNSYRLLTGSPFGHTLLMSVFPKNHAWPHSVPSVHEQSASISQSHTVTPEDYVPAAQHVKPWFCECNAAASTGYTSELSVVMCGNQYREIRGNLLHTPCLHMPNPFPIRETNIFK